MAECEHLRVGKEFLKSVTWPSALRQETHDRCYCYRCYPSNLDDTLTVAGYTYVIPRGWTRFAVSVDEGFFNHHNVWNTWLNCYHGTSIPSAKSCVEHRQLLLPSDVTMHGVELGIREGHIPGEHYVFTTPSISYAALECYAHTYNFRSPQNAKLYTIKVALQCKQKPDSIIVQPETVRAREQGIEICRYISNDGLEWKTKYRSSVMIYGLLLQIKRADENINYNAFQREQTAHSHNAKPEPIPSFKTTVRVTPDPEYATSTTTDKMDEKTMSKKRIAMLIMLVISTILPIAALIIGQLYKGSCPIQPWIPRWMTIFGAVGLASFGLIFIIMFITFKRCSDDIDVGSYISGCILCLLVFFFLAWLIAGSIWVFPAKSKVQYDQPNETNYCQEILYKFAFGFLLAQYALIGLVICFGGIIGLCALCFG